MAETDLGTAKGKIEIDSSGARKDIDEFNKSVQGMDKNSQNSSAGVKTIGVAMAGAGAAVAAGFFVAIKKAADFEETLSGIKAVSGATTSQMEDMRKKALQLGADTAFSASDAASAMEELSKAGLGVDDILNGAADATVNLAAAGGIDLPQAATIAANAMNQFNLSAQDLPHVADLIAGAANASAIDVSDFGASMQQAGATANLVGLSFDDLALAITAMGNAGIKGSDAGTSLKTFMANLQPDTEKTKKLFDDLGLSQDKLITQANPLGNAFFDSTGKIKSMAEISGILNGALDGMSEAQKSATLQTLFGSDAIRAAAVIADTGADGFNNLSASMAGITAADVARTRMDNLNGSIEQFKGSLETVAITVGSMFTPALKDAVDAATNLVNKFGELPEQTQKTAVEIAGVSAALAGVAGGAILVAPKVASAAQGISSIAGGITSVVTGLVGLLGPVGVVIVIIAAIAAAAIYAYTHFQGFRDVVNAVRDAIVSFAQTAYKWINDNVLPVLQKMWDFFENQILPAVQGFVRGFFAVVSGIVEWITGTFVPAVRNAWEPVKEAALAAWEWINEHVISTISAGIDLIVAIVQRIIDFFQLVLIPGVQTALEILAPIISAVIDNLVIAFQTGFAVIQVVVETALAIIQIIWDNFGQYIFQAISIAFTLIKTIIETVLDVIRGIFQVFTGILTGDWGKFTEGLATIWNAVWNLITTVVSTAWESIKLTINLALAAIQTVIQVTWEVIKGIIQVVMDVIHSIIETTWNTIKATIETIINAIKVLIETVWNGIKSTITTIWDAIKSAANTTWDAIKTAVITPINAVRDLLQGVWDGIKSAAQTVWDGIKSAAELAWDTIKDNIINPIRTLRNDIANVWDDIKTKASDVWNGIKSVIQGPIDAIKGFIQGLIDKVQGIIDRAIAAKNALANLNPFASDAKLSGSFGGVTAMGGIFNGAQMRIIAEAGPEAVIPLTDTNRALQLLRQSGLAALLYRNSGVGQGTNTVVLPAPDPVSQAPSAPSGPAVAIANANFYEQADVDLLLAQAEFAYQGRTY
jgi:TP901 family phage tail tape measure protein